MLERKFNIFGGISFKIEYSAIIEQNQVYVMDDTGTFKKLENYTNKAHGNRANT